MTTSRRRMAPRLSAETAGGYHRRLILSPAMQRLPFVHATLAAHRPLGRCAVRWLHKPVAHSSARRSPSL